MKTQIVLEQKVKSVEDYDDKAHFVLTTSQHAYLLVREYCIIHNEMEYIFRNTCNESSHTGYSPTKGEAIKHALEVDSSCTITECQYLYEAIELINSHNNTII